MSVGTITAVPRVSAGPAPAHPRRSRLRERTGIGLFGGPAFLVYVTVVLLPAALAAGHSSFRCNGLRALTSLTRHENSRRALSAPVFIGAIGHSLFVVVMSLIVQGPIAIGVALLLNRRLRGRTFFRVIIFIPYVLSEVIAAVSFKLLLQPAGPFDSLLHAVGLGSLKQLWLADSNVVLWVLFAVLTWKYVGFAIILFLAGLQGVPAELEEAGRIDGATWWQI